MPRLWAAETPDAPAIRFKDVTYSYSDLIAGIDKATELLRAKGIGPGDRVGLVMENCYAAVCGFFAITALEAWAVMANARLSAREIGVVLDQSGAKAALFASSDSDTAAALASAFDGSELSDPSFGSLSFAVIKAESEPEPVFDDPARQVGVMLYTSGTTGTPKGAMFTHQTLLYQAAMVSERRKFGPGDCPYVVAPMVHILGLAGMVLPLIHVGAAMEMASRFDVAAVAEAVGRGDITHLYGAAPMFAALVGYARKNGGKIAAPRVKEILAGGAPADEELRRDAAEIFSMTLGTGYAATEFSPVSASTPDNPPNPGAVGLPWHGMEMMVAGKNGEALPVGEIGEVWCRGPNAMDGYYQNTKATAEITKPGGWIALGDLAFLDEDGQIHLVGRLKEMILRSGFNVYPAEIEAVLNSHEDVLISAVVGRAVPGNEEVIAFVEGVAGKTINVDALGDWVGRQVAPYKKPARIIQLEALPVGPTGKISKTDLKERAAALDD